MFHHRFNTMINISTSRAVLKSSGDPGSLCLTGSSGYVNEGTLTHHQWAPGITQSAKAKLQRFLFWSEDSASLLISHLCQSWIHMKLLVTKDMNHSLRYRKGFLRCCVLVAATQHTVTWCEASTDLLIFWASDSQICSMSPFWPTAVEGWKISQFLNSFPIAHISSLEK